MFKRTVLYLCILLLFEGCFMFSDSLVVVDEFGANNYEKIFLEKGNYLLLEKVTKQRQNSDLLNVTFERDDFIKISRSPLTKMISREAIILRINKGDFEIKYELTINVSKDYTIFLEKTESDQEIEYLIVKKK